MKAVYYSLTIFSLSCTRTTAFGLMPVWPALCAKAKLFSNDAILSSIINKRETQKTSHRTGSWVPRAKTRQILTRNCKILPSLSIETRGIRYFKSAPLPDPPPRFDFFFPSPGPLPHRIRLRTNQQQSLTSILPVLTCEPVTHGNLKGDGTEIVTSRKWLNELPYCKAILIWFFWKY